MFLLEGIVYWSKYNIFIYSSPSNIGLLCQSLQSKFLQSSKRFAFVFLHLYALSSFVLTLKHNTHHWKSDFWKLKPEFGLSLSQRSPLEAATWTLQTLHKLIKHHVLIKGMVQSRHDALSNSYQYVVFYQPCHQTQSAAYRERS